MSSVNVSSNQIISNTASPYGVGGGITLWDSQGTIASNNINYNDADSAGGI